MNRERERHANSSRRFGSIVAWGSSHRDWSLEFAAAHVHFPWSRLTPALSKAKLRFRGNFALLDCSRTAFRCFCIRQSILELPLPVIMPLFLQVETAFEDPAENR